MIVQQESGFGRYLAARGVAGDPRLGTTYQWYPAEMIAEDYHELFGSENAKLAWQMNRDIPAPDQVPGLRAWFLDTFHGGAARLTGAVHSQTGRTGLAAGPSTVS